jgi:hypothetical protein
MLWIRIQMGSLDPYPDPDSLYGSGSKRAKMVQKNRKEVLDAPISGLKAFPVA